MSGAGTYVDHEVVTAATSKGVLAKYIYGQDDDDGYWETTTGGKHSATLNVWWSFSNGSLFCGGAASTTSPADYKNSVCFTIHN
ncbi:hypothetical protein [Actinacidiphila yanglinensis]|uniref:hypothetical protein n=1 Tax=Actinacidiphila yanglinensis TaxID=310779 RepID=UPI0011B01A41|nr:hypothetical protein [Actinacidiphila yanglinensis]